MRPFPALALTLAASLTLLVGCGKDEGFTLSKKGLTFTARQTEGADPQSIDITVSDSRAAYVGAAYAAGQSQPSWLRFAVSQVEGRRFRLDVYILDTSLPVGTHRTTFLVGTADANGNVLETRNVTVTLRIDVLPLALLVWNANTLSFTESDGSAPGSGLLTLQLNGIEPKTCQATISVQDEGRGWLQASPTAVTVSLSPVTITVSALPGQPTGAFAGSILIGCVVDGLDLSTQVPAKLVVDDHRLVPSTVGVALVSSPSRSSLAREVRIGDSLGRETVPWSATSDQPWLTVTPAGTAPGALQLSADPAGLAPGTHFAWVTISSTDQTLAPTERIRVGFTVLDADPGMAFQGGYFKFLAASPVEPVVFASSEGTDVVGYDLNTGAAVRTFTNVAAAASSLAVSGDGTLLYVWDTSAFKVHELDAVTGAPRRSFASSPNGVWYPDARSGLAWVRPAGRPALLTPSSHAYDLATGAWVGDFFESVNGAVVPTADGAGVIAGAALFALHRASTPWNRIWAVQVADPSPGFGYKACPSTDGGHIYGSASQSVYDWDVVAGVYGTSYPTPGAGGPNAVACATNGLLVTGTSVLPEGADLWVFAPPSRTPMASLYSTGAPLSGYGGASTLAVSADATRVVAMVALQYGPAWGLYFQALPDRP